MPLALPYLPAPRAPTVYRPAEHGKAMQASRRQPATWLRPLVPTVDQPILNSDHGLCPQAMRRGLRCQWIIGACLPGLSYQQLAEAGSATTPSVRWNTLAQLPSRKVTFSTPKCWSSR